MSTVTTARPTGKKGFAAISRAFLQSESLPFARVLDADQIQDAFREEDCLFAQDQLFSTQIVLWAFLAQCLRDGKGAACTAAVQDIATYLIQTNREVPSGDTGDYCRARAKLSLPALRRLVIESARQLQDEVDASWLWQGHHAKLVDGFTFTMPDTLDNQKAFPQNPSQEPGVGFPIARACAILSLATGCVCDVAIGPYAGKETGENALLRDMLDVFDEDDVVVFDRYYCSYMMLALLSIRGAQVCTRVHQRRRTDFRRGTRLGHEDHLITWTRPERPPWMSSETYDQIPETLTFRELRYDVDEPGCRTSSLTVITSLTDAKAYPKEAIAELYGLRWNVELDIRAIKQSLNLEHLRCKTAHMIHLELWVTLLAYNLIRKVIAMSAAVHEKQPRCLSFTAACQAILSAWMLFSVGCVQSVQDMRTMLLTQIAAAEVGNRPDRVEPRVIKRRRHHYPLMQHPRDKLRTELVQT